MEGGRLKNSAFSLACALLLLFSACVLSCARERDASSPEDQAGPRNPLVETARVVRAPISRAYTAVGSVSPREVSRISPKITGRIQSVPVDESDPVSRGDLLMLIDPFDYRQALANADSQLKQAQSSLERVERDLARMEGLYREKAVTEQSFQDALTARDLARFQRDQALVARQVAQKNLRECRVVSPIPGVVTQVLVNEGELTGPQQPAFVVMDMSTVKVEVDLPEEIFGSVRTGGTSLVTIDALPGQGFEGVITKIYPTIDPASRTFRVTITLDNPGMSLRPGMTARSRVVQTLKNDALAVPKDALFRGEDGFLVYTVKNGVIGRVPVTTGIEGETLFEVASGLFEHDQVVVRGIAGLKPGMTVSTVAEDRSSGE
jgi:RND family efflux transporter MFP subunit